MASLGGHGTSRSTGSRRRASPAVYRRRRLAVLLLAVVVSVALVAGGTALAEVLGGRTASSSAGPATAEPPPHSANEPSPDAADEPSGGSDACGADAVVVSAETDRQTYGPSETPVLSLVIRNDGTVPCTVNVGTSQMEFVVASGDDRIFSSIDCQQASQDLERTIAPGGEERAPFAWSRNRTVPGCTLVDGQPAPGTYSLTTRLGTRSSEPVQFTLQ